MMKMFNIEGALEINCLLCKIPVVLMIQNSVHWEDFPIKDYFNSEVIASFQLPD